MHLCMTLILEFLCLSYSTLLFSCQSASDTSKEAASLAGQLTHISTIAFFRQAFFAAFLIFFMFFWEKIAASAMRIFLSTISCGARRCAPYPPGPKTPSCEEDGVWHHFLFAARTGLAVARTVGRRLVAAGGTDILKHRHRRYLEPLRVLRSDKLVRSSAA